MIDSYSNMHFLHVMKKLAFFSKRAKFDLYLFLDEFFKLCELVQSYGFSEEIS